MIIVNLCCVIDKFTYYIINNIFKIYIQDIYNSTYYNNMIRYIHFITWYKFQF